MRKTFSPNMKVDVVLAVLSSTKTIAQITSEFSVHETQIHEWKRQAKEGLAAMFSGGRDASLPEKDAMIERLYAPRGTTGC